MLSRMGRKMWIVFLPILFFLSPLLANASILPVDELLAQHEGEVGS